MEKYDDHKDIIAKFRGKLSINKTYEKKPSTLKEFCEIYNFPKERRGLNLASFTLGINRFRKLKPEFLSAIEDFLYSEGKENKDNGTH